MAKLDSVGKHTVGMYPTFDRSGSPTRSSHYCAGCGHGILHKLIMEALVEMGLQDRTILVNPIGCAVFGYYYWDVGNIGAAHGRAPAVATALARTRPDALVIAYQGDGDLAAIGLNCALQAANRGERMVTFLVNNATYGMTGGQMSPTTLIGQTTPTSPGGRDAVGEGYPLHVCELFNQLRAPVLIARCSVADTPRILQARKIIRQALEIQRDGRGYALVEILSPCTNVTGGDAIAAARFVSESLEKEFPLGVFRDRTAESRPDATPPRSRPADELFGGLAGVFPDPVRDAALPERQLVFAGSGGQGILSLGLCVANAGALAGRFTTWYPTYGPEQRGGAASCSLVLAGQPVGAPSVDHPDVLVCMTPPMLKRFLPTVKPGGVVFCDSLVLDADASRRPDVRLVSIPATELAAAAGYARAGNTAILAAMAHTGVTGLPESAIGEARDLSLRKKPALVELNRKLYDSALAWCRENLS